MENNSIENLIKEICDDLARLTVLVNQDIQIRKEFIENVEAEVKKYEQNKFKFHM